MTIRQSPQGRRVPRVLYSFPYRIGAGRICLTAWQQVDGAAPQAEMTVLCGFVDRPLPSAVKVVKTLGMGKLRLPMRLVGRNRMLALHDWMTARWLEANAGGIDLVHCWPGAALRTIRTARRFGIPTLLERPNAHTAYAFEAEAEESRRCGIQLKKGHDHSFNQRTLDHETQEYEESDFLLCPSDFVARSFLDRGFAARKLLPHQYGFDEGRFTPGPAERPQREGLEVVYAGVCEPRKGLHYALEAWQASEAGRAGSFRICGNFVPGYRQSLSPLLENPRVHLMGQRDDLPKILSEADVLVLSSVEEGSALVCYEAIGAGCVLLVSDASGAKCRHGTDSLVHRMRAVDELAEHFSQLHLDRALLATLRRGALASRDGLTWKRAGQRLSSIYQQVLAAPSLPGSTHSLSHPAMAAS
jgi:glycosyltransferase involved in cell wall biosynthesis